VGIGLATVHLLARHVPSLRVDRALTLGTQDCYFTLPQIVSFFQRHQIPHEAVQQVEYTTGFKWEPRPELRADCIHQRTLFSMLGVREVLALDANGFEGAEIVHDLNVPISPALRDSFDVVFDGGTLEHVFSIKDALDNVAAMCRVGGHVVHQAPVDYINHGFINVNAELLRDYYTSNGFVEVSSHYVATPVLASKWRRQHMILLDPAQVTTTLRPHYGLTVFAVYEKRKSVPPVIPQQGYYQTLWAGGDSRPPHRLKLWIAQNIPGYLATLPYRVRARGKKIVL
jgi:hypothetical protein